jgi:hypothetical protein
MCAESGQYFPPSDLSTHTLSRRKPEVKAVSPLIALLPSRPAITHEAAVLRGLATGDTAQKLEVEQQESW